jgi:toxin ParE1/3/4
MPYKTTPEAENDLIGIYVYGFKSFGEGQAEKYFSEMEGCFQLLSETPLICRERTEFTPPVRIHHHGRHLIIYVIRDDFILIIRILHDSMDLPRHLSST